MNYSDFLWLSLDKRYLLPLGDRRPVDWAHSTMFEKFCCFILCFHLSCFQFFDWHKYNCSLGVGNLGTINCHGSEVSKSNRLKSTSTHLSERVIKKVEIELTKEILNFWIRISKSFHWLRIIENSSTSWRSYYWDLKLFKFREPLIKTHHIFSEDI